MNVMLEMQERRAKLCESNFGRKILEHSFFLMQFVSCLL